MRKFIIERKMPQAGAMKPAQLQAAAAKSNEALAKLAPRVQWQHSYVVDDGTYCVYVAEDENVVKEHARLSGFPADRIVEVAAMIDPVTADKPAATAA